MTRETKLALIIGFALVMVVGVLISDHLAGSSRTPVADLTIGPAGGTTIQQSDRESDPPNASSGTRRSDPVPTRTRLVPDQPLVQLSQGSRGTSGASSSNQPRQARSPGAFAQAVDRARDVVPTLGELLNPAARPNAGSPTGDSQSQAKPMVWHTVAEDESLWQIAKAYYGKGSRWSEIAAANPGRVGADGAVREGVKLKIPGGRPAQTATPTPSPVRSTTDAVDTYTVKAGDTLGQIAQRLLGTMKRADEIVALNRTMIANADEIRAGMVLRMPAR